eukprot:673180-Rhodomonas_salina.1
MFAALRAVLTSWSSQFMSKLGVEYYTFHDTDVAPAGELRHAMPGSDIAHGSRRSACSAKMPGPEKVHVPRIRSHVGRDQRKPRPGTSSSILRARTARTTLLAYFVLQRWWWTCWRSCRSRRNIVLPTLRSQIEEPTVLLSISRKDGGYQATVVDPKPLQQCQ